ncbi:MAG: hypothetical protein KAI99_09160 [Cyclobacteriaceae bacterium]|nr:hypothetical protein [Cyclobacteriaceae bacterium]
MIWALLFSIIFGGSESVFLDSKVKKHIKRHVVEKDSRKEILLIIKNFEKEAKKLRKGEKKWNKELVDLNANRAATSGEFRAFFQRYMEAKKVLNDSGLSARIEIRDKLSPETWGKIIADARSTYEKEGKKRTKYISKLKKSLSKIEKKVGKEISDVSRRTEVIKAVQEFKNSVVETQKEYDRFNYAENAALANYNSSLNDLQKVQEEIDLLLWQLFDAFIDTHMNLVNATTEDEWYKVQKSFNKIL